jgi:hypothetical protein
MTSAAPGPDRATTRRSRPPAAPDPKPLRTGVHDRRAALDTIIQSSVVDLFHSTGIAVAPVERTCIRPERVRLQDLAAQIQFSAPRFSGTLTLSVPGTVFAHVAPVGGRRLDGNDWVREMVNQIFGRLKRRLLVFQLQLNAGLPGALTRDGFDRERAKPGFMVYAFRTLRGDVLLTMSGELDYSLLSYASAVSIPNDGDVILF